MNMQAKTLSLYHLVRLPEVDEAAIDAMQVSGKPPLLILLHGVGSNEEDLFSLAPLLDERFLVITPRAPYTLGPGQFGWYHVFFLPTTIDRDEEEAEQSRQRLISFIREA